MATERSIYVDADWFTADRVYVSLICNRKSKFDLLIFLMRETETLVSMDVCRILYWFKYFPQKLNFDSYRWMKSVLLYDY